MGPSGATWDISSRLAPYAPDWEAAADDLAETGDVGVDAVEGLRAAVGHSEAGDDFIKYEEAAVVAGDASETG